MNKCFWLFATLFLVLNSMLKVNGGVIQKKLLSKLFDNYDPSERPVQNENENLLVSIGLCIQQIVEIDEKTQTLIFSGWLDMSWTDFNLRWDPDEFGNISIIRVQSSKIWIPDILLYNSAADTFDPKTDVNAVIYSSGEVSFLPPGMFRSTCQIEIDQFPFDEQKCKLKFGSWTYDEDTVDLKNKSDTAQLDSYTVNGEWDLEKVISYSEAIKYECCPTKYPFVMFILHLRRRTLYFIFNLIFPCVLISFMCILGFTLPPDAGEKIGLEITTLLSIMMFSQLITTIVPDSSLSIPKISLYFAAVSVICTLSIFCNVGVLVLHHKSIQIQGPVPEWIDKWINGYLARLLRMEIPGSKDEEDEEDKKLSINGFSDMNAKSLLANVLDINDDFGLTNKPKKTKLLLKSEGSTSCENCSDNSRSLDPSCKKLISNILKELQVLTKKIQDDAEDEEKELAWKFAAMVIDRLCMWIFAISTFIATVGILLTAKNFFKFQ